MPDNENFSVTKIPLAKDACSCGVCFARNTGTKSRPPVDIYELRVGRSVTRLCENCVTQLRTMLDTALDQKA